MQFFVIGQKTSPPTGEETLIHEKLLEFQFEPLWLDADELFETCADDMLGIIITNRNSEVAVRDERFLSFLETLEVPLLALGDGAGMLLSAFTGSVGERSPRQVERAVVEVNNDCILFDFLPNLVEVENRQGAGLPALPEGFAATAHDQEGKVVAFQHNTRELFAIDLPMHPSQGMGSQVMENFIRYAGFFSGEL